ncbi:hypothetical protein AAG906_005404 [Vitis piasezkii]
MAVENTSPTLLPFNTMIHMVTIKLSSSNYLLWKSQLLSLLKSQELLGHVDGTLAPPPLFAPADSQTPNIKHLAWKNTDQSLLSLLLSSLTEEAMTWDAIGNRICSVFKALCDQLHAIGRPVDDTNKVHWFLHGLGSDFTSFSTAQMAQTPLPSFPDLVSKAKSFELFQILNNYVATHLPTMAMAIPTPSRAAVRHAAKSATKKGTMLISATNGMHGVENLLAPQPTLPRPLRPPALLVSSSPVTGIWTQGLRPT